MYVYVDFTKVVDRKSLVLIQSTLFFCTFFQLYNVVIPLNIKKNSC